MDEYINRDATIKAIHDVYEYGFPTASGAFDDFATKIVPSLLNSIPAADVAPVVRCKECAHLFYTMCAAFGFLPRKPNDFCSYGERKDGGGDND